MNTILGCSNDKQDISFSLYRKKTKKKTVHERKMQTHLQLSCNFGIPLILKSTSQNNTGSHFPFVTYKRMDKHL